VSKVKDFGPARTGPLCRAGSLEQTANGYFESVSFQVGGKACQPIFIGLNSRFDGVFRWRM